MRVRNENSNVPKWRKTKHSRVASTKLVVLFLMFATDKIFNVSNCCYCGKGLTFSEFTVEHLIPQIAFFNSTELDEKQLDAFGNLAVACKTCNSAKGNKSLLEFCGKAKANKILKIANKPLDYKSAYVTENCIRLAKSNESRKFSRTYQNGRFFNETTCYKHEQKD